MPRTVAGPTQLDPIFLRDGARFSPTVQARGPWDPQALHGGAPAALIVRALEQHEPQPQMRFARLSFELLRTLPFALLRIETRTVRPGRRVQELAAELYADSGADGEQLICRASALRVQAVPDELPELPAGTLATDRMPALEEAREIRFALNPEDRDESFAATAMEMRWLNDPWAPGPGRVWQRLRLPLVDDEPASPLARLAASADFGNGISASLPFDGFLFINADLHVHLHREPRGEWIGLDARTLLHPGGTGLAETVLHDLDGPIGRGFQSLVVGAR
jgi:Acyl-CoA thioesterase C-terminal domain/Acyl-CoA thioesterase N-terminal domain